MDLEGRMQLQRSTILDAIRPAAHAMAVALSIFAITRGALWLVSWMVANFFPGQSGATFGQALFGLACKWDCGWYLSIVNDGYSMVEPAVQPGATNYAFFPLFPMLVKALSGVLDVSPVTAGLLVSNAAFVAALAYIYRYATLLGGSERAATLAVTLICVVPGTFAFSVVYTESLFLLLLVAGMYHFRHGDFLLSSIAAALLSSVRANGIFFLVFPIASIIRTYGLAGLLQPWLNPRPFLPIVFAPLGLFLFWTYSFLTTGDAFAQATTVAAGWGWRWQSPVASISTHLAGDAQAQYWMVSGLAVFACSFFLLKQKLYEEFAFCFAVFLLIFGAQIPSSLLRYSIALFPIWIGLANVLDRRDAAAASVIGAMGVVSGCLMAAWTLSLHVTI